MFRSLVIAGAVGAASLLPTPAPAHAHAPAELCPAGDARVAVITGSTGGLGRALALTLGSEGWHVVVHGRNAEAGAAVVAEIQGGPGSASFLAADFASLEEVRSFGEAVVAGCPRIDAFVANAGIWLDPAQGRQENAEGVELQFQVNYLSHFLLSRMLVPRLRETAAAEGEARIIQVASTAQSPIQFDDVMLEEGNAHSRGYGQSKLAQILLANDLAEELEGTGVISVSLHPATLMNTGMVMERGIEPRATVEEGLEAVLRLVVADDVSSGQYYRGLEPVDPNPQAMDRSARERLRNLSRELTGGP
jgi:NAD(P)-dependent dehydrogenase (short-subunit alcohol dehydrogenase family)